VLLHTKNTGNVSPMRLDQSVTYALVLSLERAVGAHDLRIKRGYVS